VETKENQTVVLSGDNISIKSNSEVSIEQQRINLERQKIDIKQKKPEIELERITIEKSKEKTNRILSILQAIISIFALTTPVVTTFFTNQTNEISLIV